MEELQTFCAHHLFNLLWRLASIASLCLSEHHEQAFQMSLGGYN
jgi:hypothetical protein